jgi:hypothetical protein
MGTVGVKLTTDLQLVDLYIHSPIYLHSVVLNPVKHRENYKRDLIKK